MTRFAPRTLFIAGFALVLALAALWHGPLGNGAARYVAYTENVANEALVLYEMDQQVAVMNAREPVQRRLWLAGTADDFQREQLVLLLDQVPSIGDVNWWSEGGGTVRGEPMLPMIVEIELAALAAYIFGIMLAYFHALRRHARRHDYI